MNVRTVARPGAVGARGGAEGRPRLGGAALPIRTPSVYEWPFIFVLGYLLVDYGRPHNWVPALSVIRPGMLVLSGGILSLLSRRTFPTPPLARSLLWFFGLMVVMTPFAVNSRMAFNVTRDFGLFLLGACLPIIAFVDTFERLQIAIRFFVALHVPLALYSLTHRGVGVGSFLTDENDFALAMNMVLPYAVAMFAMGKGLKKKMLWAFVIFIQIAGSMATLSRGGFIGLVCLGGVIWWRSQQKILSLFAAVVLVAMMAAMTPESYWKEMQTIETADQAGDTGYERLYLWTIGWRIFLDYPVSGVGPFNFQYVNYRYEDPTRIAEGRHVWGQVSHSLYFTLLPELGTVGVVLFAVMLIRGYRERKRLIKRCKVLLADKDLPAERRLRIEELRQLLAAMDASTVTFLVTGAFIAVLYYPHIWLLTAFVAAISNISTKELADVNTPGEPAKTPGGPVIGPLARSVPARGLA
jgi:O-Antigen ligase